MSTPLIRLGEQPPAPDFHSVAADFRPAAAKRSSQAMVRTGPSGLLVGAGHHGAVSIRLFRPRPTRVLLTVGEYVSWLLAFRCISLGAHLSIIARDRRRWQGLADAVQGCGGTVDILSERIVLPTQGRPYRPSLIIDDEATFDGLGQPLGAWQALLLLDDAGAGGAIHQLRRCDMAIVSPCESRVTENLRRAYALTPRQIKLAANLNSNEAILAMPRRVLRVAIPPTQTEYAVLFG